MHVRLSECGVDPDEMVMRANRTRGVLDPSSKKGQFRESVNLHAANVAEPTEGLPHQHGADGGQSAALWSCSFVM